MNTRGKRYHPVKPARSYKEQLARLTDIHGLTIEDEARARYILSTVNYYRLTTYGQASAPRGRPGSLSARRIAGDAVRPIPV